jgi:hypothetical protein
MDKVQNTAFKDLNRMSEDRLPVKASKYRQRGSQDLGRPRKRWVPVQAEEPGPWRGGEQHRKGED